MADAKGYNPDPSPYSPPAGAPPPGYAVPMNEFPPPTAPQQGYPGQAYPPQGVYVDPGQPQVVYAQPTTTAVVYAPAPVVMNPATGPSASSVPDYMATSIINLLFCCFILGLLALLKSNECQQAKSRNDYNAARSASQSAKALNMIGIIIGLLAWLSGIVIIIIYCCVVVAVATNYGY